MEGLRLKKDYKAPTGSIFEKTFDCSPFLNKSEKTGKEGENRKLRIEDCDPKTFKYSCPRPFRRRDGADSYDFQDFNAPPDNSIDSISEEFGTITSAVTKQKCSNFDTLVEDMGRLVGDGGVKKKIFVEGLPHPDGRKVLDGCRVWIHYESFAENKLGDSPISLDSSKQHRLATAIKVGETGIPGLYFALKSMQKNEIADFVFEPEYAYLKKGVPGFIKPNTRVRMIIQLLEIDTNPNPSVPLELMNELDREMADFNLDDVLSSVEKLVKAGKDKVELMLYRDAIDRYNIALSLLDDHGKSGWPMEDELVDKKRFQIYSNLALCHIRQEDYKEAVKCCEAAMQLLYHDGMVKPKVIYRQALGLFQLKKYKEALPLCRRGLNCAWGKTEFTFLLEKVKNAILAEQILEEEKKARDQEADTREETGFELF